MAKRSKASYRLAALKGWRTRARNAEFKRRSKAAKKGWETRRAARTWEVSLGYQSSKDNSYSLRILIRTRKQLSKDNVVELVQELIGSGHFDDSIANTSTDLRWAASGINSWYAKHVPDKMKPGTAYLLDFDRSSPEPL